jgi:hypothetical protein
MRRVRRDEILDYVSYREQRERLRPLLMRARAERRVHLGDQLTFLFENHETIRYQIQEMTLAERMVREADIQRELDTYNALLGGDGELGCTLLVEIPDARERARKLAAWRTLPDHVYVRLADATKVGACHEPPLRRDRLSPVQYLRFAVHGRVPVAVGCDLDLAGAAGETLLSPEQRSALRRDLA